MIKNAVHPPFVTDPNANLPFKKKAQTGSKHASKAKQIQGPPLCWGIDHKKRKEKKRKIFSPPHSIA
jgi:hypothetical protein